VLTLGHKFGNEVKMFDNEDTALEGAIPNQQEAVDFGVSGESEEPEARSSKDVVNAISSEKEGDDKRAAEKKQHEAPIGSLAAHVKNAWSAAVNAKMTQGITETLLNCSKQRDGEYEDDVKKEIKETNGSSVYMMLTNIKCRAGEGWIRDVMLPGGEKPWGIEPSVVVDLPKDRQKELEELVMQESASLMINTGIGGVTIEQIKDRMDEVRIEIEKKDNKKAKTICKRLESYIEDELRSGNFYTALGEVITDLMTFPTAFMKGPVVRSRKCLSWGVDEEMGDPIPVVKDKLVREYDRVSPYDIFPSPGAKNLQDGYLCERLRFRRKDLLAMINTPGWAEDAIRGVLSDYGEGGLREYLSGDYSRAVAEGRPSEFEDPDPPIEGCLFNGFIQGQKLREWGLEDKKITDPLAEYEVQVCLIGTWVVMARLNGHPLGKRNYYGASFESVNDSIWGKSPPMLMKDVQRVCNAVARALVNNVGIASGPQVNLETDRLMPGEDIERVWPWKVWKTKESMRPSGGSAVNFWQPQMQAQQLLSIYTYFFEQASEQSGIPAYIYGNSNMGGAGSTASGLSMLMNAASKTLKNVIAHIDENIITEAIKEHWLQVMLFDDVEKYGDIQVTARASQYLVILEQLQLRLSEFLDRTNNPTDIAIIGPERRANLLRQTAKAHKLPVDDIVPTKQEMDQQKKEQEAMMMMMQQQQQQQEMAMMQQQQATQQGGAIPQQVQEGAAMSPDGGMQGQEPGRMM